MNNVTVITALGWTLFISIRVSGMLLTVVFSSNKYYQPTNALTVNSVCLSKTNICIADRPTASPDIRDRNMYIWKKNTDRY